MSQINSKLLFSILRSCINTQTVPLSTFFREYKLDIYFTSGSWKSRLSLLQNSSVGLRGINTKRSKLRWLILFAYNGVRENEYVFLSRLINRSHSINRRRILLRARKLTVIFWPSNYWFYYSIKWYEFVSSTLKWFDN